MLGYRSGAELRFPVCRELAEQGGTDYYAQGSAFGQFRRVFMLESSLDRRPP
jgi:hypothetical protein